MLIGLAFLVMPARAALPWECPVVALPVDAASLRDTDAGLADAARSLYALAAARVDDGCVWEEATTGDGVTSSRTERRCEVGADTVTIAEWWGVDSDSGAAWSGWELEVRTPAESWTRILVRGSADMLGQDDWTRGPADDARAEWDGAVAGLPDDAWLEYAAGQSEGWPSVRTRTASTPGCAWTWSLQDDGDFAAEAVRVGDTRVEVGGYRAPDCAEMPIWATLNGAVLGAADRDTWELNPADTDHDGVVPDCDCDDANAAVNPYAADRTTDGVDQNCDGVDGAPSPEDTAPEDTANADTAPEDTAPEDTAHEDTDRAARPIASWTSSESSSCFGAASSAASSAASGAALLLGLTPLVRRRRR